MFKLSSAGVAAACMVMFSAPVIAEESYDPPRTETGRPDLQGVWSNASVTRLTRPRGYPLVLTPEQAAELEGGNLYNQRLENESGPIDPNAPAPEKGKPLPPVGNYDVAWTDPGSKIAVVNGELRSSWIVYPENGQMPAMTTAGRDFRRANPRRRGSGYDNPEERGLSERCIVIGTAGPPLGQYLYNNNVQIVQTGDHLMIMTEMIHDVRVVRIGGEPKPAALDAWMGDSVGWWDGDTLVVETRNVNDQQRSNSTLLSDDAVVTEKFTRVSDSQILYEFAINDPTFYEDEMRAESVLNANPEPIFEYACHEGNYGLENILSGGRQNDRLGIEHTGGEERGEH